MFKQLKSISTVKGNSYFLARMPKPSKDKLEIRKFEVEIKVNNEREKYAENQLVELKETERIEIMIKEKDKKMQINLAIPIN